VKKHVVLLGDSIFDNAVYVSSGQSVSDHLRAALGDRAEVALLAVDGATTIDVPPQFDRIPHGATHLFLSCGGNDALLAKSYLDGAIVPDAIPEALRGALSEAGFDLLGVLSVIQQEFRRRYRRVVVSLVATGRPAAVCTVYDRVPGLEPKYLAALSLFNDVIISEAIRHRLSVIDLRPLCDQPSDYSDVSPIEPSGSGGLKIAGAIARVVEGDRSAVVSSVSV